MKLETILSNALAVALVCVLITSIACTIWLINQRFADAEAQHRAVGFIGAHVLLPDGRKGTVVDQRGILGDEEVVEYTAKAGTERAIYTQEELRPDPAWR